MLSNSHATNYCFTRGLCAAEAHIPCCLKHKTERGSHPKRAPRLRSLLLLYSESCAGNLLMYRGVTSRLLPPLILWSKVVSVPVSTVSFNAFVAYFNCFNLSSAGFRSPFQPDSFKHGVCRRAHTPRAVVTRSDAVHMISTPFGLFKVCAIGVENSSTIPSS